MARKFDRTMLGGLWEAAAVVAVLVAAVAYSGGFFVSVKDVLSADNSPNFAFAYREGENPWANVVVLDDAGRDTRRASLPQSAKAPAF